MPILNFHKAQNNEVIGTIGFGKPQDHDGNVFAGGDHSDTADYKYNPKDGTLGVSLTGKHGMNTASADLTVRNLSADDAIAYANVFDAALQGIVSVSDPTATRGADLKSPDGTLPANSALLKKHLSAAQDATTAVLSDAPPLEKIAAILAKADIKGTQANSKDTHDNPQLEGATKFQHGDRSIFVQGSQIWDPAANGHEGDWANAGDIKNKQGHVMGNKIEFDTPYALATKAAELLNLGDNRAVQTSLAAQSAAHHALQDVRSDSNLSPNEQAQRLLGATATQTERFRQTATAEGAPTQAINHGFGTAPPVAFKMG